jgi:hypothetical protein
MANSGLYRYPFDKNGDPTLTFGEAVTAARVLEAQLNGLIDRWTWPEVYLRIIERRPGYVRYEVERNGKFVGYATVMPYTVEAPKKEPGSAGDAEGGEEQERRGA